MFAESEIGSAKTAAQKGYSDKIKELDAMGILRVTNEIDANDGKITPEVATMIDTETARIKGSMADIRVLDEMGEPFTKGGERKPMFLQSLKTGALHKLPAEWSGDAVPLTDVEGNVLGYGVRNASGGITQLRQQAAATDKPMPAERRAAMNTKMRSVDQWWKDLNVRDRSKPEAQQELNRRIKAVEDEFSSQPEPATAAPSDFQNTYDALPSGSRYTAPDGTLRTKR